MSDARDTDPDWQACLAIYRDVDTAFAAYAEVMYVQEYLELPADAQFIVSFTVSDDTITYVHREGYRQ